MFKIENKGYIPSNFYLENTINLKETDVYTQYKFEELQHQRFEENLDYYICIVKQHERT